MHYARKMMFLNQTCYFTRRVSTQNFSVDTDGFGHKIPDFNISTIKRAIIQTELSKVVGLDQVYYELFYKCVPWVERQKCIPTYIL